MEKIAGPSNGSQIKVRMISGKEDQSKLEALLNASFGVASGASFYDDFPVWNEKFGNPMVRLGAFDQEGNLASSASIRISTLVLKGALMQVGLIGCVVTSPEWRGKGLATELVRGLADWADDEKIELCLLWGSEHSLYEKLGFNLFGEQVRVPVSSVANPRVSSERRIRFGWNPSIMSALRTRGSGLMLGAQDEVWLSAHKNVDWYWVGSPEKPAAYAAVNRGIDLHGMVHEWGGELESLKELLTALARLNPALQLIGPPFLFKRYGLSYDPQGLEYVCMARASEAAAARIKDSNFWIWGLDGC